MRRPRMDRRPPLTAGAGICLAMCLALPQARGQMGQGAQPFPCCPGWTVRAEALFLQRSDGGDAPLVWADNGAGERGAVLLTADDLNFDHELGPRITVGRLFRDCSELELSYFGIFDWEASQSIASPAGAPIHLPAFNPFLAPPGVATFHADSELHSAELNYRRSAAPWLSWLVGLRWVEFSDDLLLEFTNLGGATQTILTTDTNNHLYGVQVGADAYVWSRGALRMDSWIKAGIYTNVADQSTSVPLLPAGASADKDNAAFLGELGVAVACQLTERLAARGGYQAMWLEGVALAPDQLAVTDVTVPFALVDTDGGVFFHGGFIGLEAAW